MKTVLTATAFTLTLSLSGLAHAAFKDQGPTADIRSATATTQQDLSHLPTASGFNEKSAHVEIANPAPRTGSNSMALGANCDLSPTVGFQDSTSASC